MKRAIALGLVAALAHGCASLGSRSASAPAASDAADLPAPTATLARLVLVTIHGLTPDLYLAPDPVMPTLAELARAGVAAEAMTPVFPATVYATHATLVTGVEPSHHGVGGDHRMTPRGVSGAFLDRVDDVRAPSLFGAVATLGGGVAALDWPSTGGAAIADLAPDLVLPTGASWADALAQRGAGRVPELAQRSGGGDPAAAEPSAARDAALVTMACGLFVADPPTRLVALRLSGTAASLAAHAAGGDAARSAFAAADLDLARLVRCLGDAGLLATTGIAVAGDFGLAGAHTELRPNVALVDAGLVVADGQGVQRWDAIARANGGSAFVYAADEDSAVLAREALERFANETGASRVVSAKEMVSRGADAEAWFGLEADPGFVFGDAPQSPRGGTATVASAALGNESAPRAAAGFVAWGPGLRPGLRIPSMRQTDVAPTLARWLGVGLADVQGRSLVGLFGAGGS